MGRNVTLKDATVRGLLIPEEIGARRAQGAGLRGFRMQTNIASMIREEWTAHRTAILRVTNALLAVYALFKLTDEFRRLVLDNSHAGAIDLLWYFTTLRSWFAGGDVYHAAAGSEYPPASYAILWPLLGWLPENSVRWFWALISAIALGWLVLLTIRESKADDLIERVFVAMIPLSMNATGVTVGNGQLILFILPMVISAVLLLQQRERTVAGDVIASALLLFTLVKPSVSVPFFWIVFFASAIVFSALLVSIGYILLTVVAASFQPMNLPSLIETALRNGATKAISAGYANLHIWMAELGLGNWILHVSFVILLLSGIWTLWHRQRDVWLLLGVAAIVARFWTYHR